REPQSEVQRLSLRCGTEPDADDVERTSEAGRHPGHHISQKSAGQTMKGCCARHRIVPAHRYGAAVDRDAHANGQLSRELAFRARDLDDAVFDFDFYA